MSFLLAETFQKDFPKTNEHFKMMNAMTRKRMENVSLLFSMDAIVQNSRRIAQKKPGWIASIKEIINHHLKTPLESGSQSDHKKEYEVADEKIFLLIQGMDAYESLEFKEIVARYMGLTVLLQEHINFMIKNIRGSVIEIGAGSGLLARRLKNNGVNIYPYDLKKYTASKDMEHTDGCTWSDQWTDLSSNVIAKDHNVVKLHKKNNDEKSEFPFCETLLMSWPEMTTMAYETLKNFTGDVLIYIGEYEGCCGNSEFFEELSSYWVNMISIPPIRFYSNKDSIFIFHRRN